jgi:argininosuccinate lyase
MKKPWGGRFKESTDQLMIQFSASIFFDQRLYAYDIEGSIAHCHTLAKCKIISDNEAKKIITGLRKILKEFDSGKFKIREDLEDIHMNIEHRLIELVGPVGGKLHTGRSRNDQIALDVRLYLRHEIKEIQAGLNQLAKTLIRLSRKHVNTIIPGYTHLQRAQPILLAHHLLAYVEMLGRDRDRMADALARVNIMPLGSAALAGTNFPIDRRHTAKLLGFPKITHNSLDAVSDRDFIIEFCSGASMLMMHLSRFCEEIVLWCTSEFKFLELSDAFTTGSSIMPQKKNPDAAELIRGKTGRVYGNLMNLLTLMKAQPLAYNKDLQEDKEPLFDTVDTVKVALEIFNGMLDTATFKKIPPAELAKEGFLTATDLADYLVLKNVPFRVAHEITGKTVAFCIEQECSLEDLTLNDLHKISKRFHKDVFDYIAMENSVQRKNVYGGTAKSRVQEQLKRLSNEWR